MNNSTNQKSCTNYENILLVGIFFSNRLDCNFFPVKYQKQIALNMSPEQLLILQSSLTTPKAFAVILIFFSICIVLLDCRRESCFQDSGKFRHLVVGKMDHCILTGIALTNIVTAVKSVAAALSLRAKIKLILSFLDLILYIVNNFTKVTNITSV